MNQLHYWDRLAKLKIFSLQRRRDRYIVIYIWKVLHGFFPNPGFNIESIDRNDGIFLNLPLLQTKGRLKKLKERSIIYYGVQLFRSLPSHLRKIQTANDHTVTPLGYKSQLDRYLRTLPDEPTSDTRQRRSKSNNIIDQKVYQRK